MPKEYDLDYLVFQLSDGDVTRARVIWESVSFDDCMTYVSFKQYEAYVNELIMEKP